MMNPDKHRIVTKHMSDESDSLRHQHSSLAVNLSCSSNLTDSGNGSLRQTNVECNDKVLSPAIGSNTTQRSRRYRSFRDRQASVNNISDVTHQNVPLKYVSATLKRIKNDAESLDKSCEILKQVILTKTKQMFDRQNELSVKTQAVLSNNFDQRIDSTPKDKQKSKNVRKQRKQCTLNKRRLFDSKDCSQNTSRNESDHIGLKNKIHSNITVPVNSNQTVDISNLASVNNRTNYSVTSKDKCLPNLNVSEDDSILIAVPIGCSTMIQDETLDTYPETHHDINDLPSHCKTKKDTVSMEITRIQQECVLNNKRNSLAVEQTSKTQFSKQNTTFEEHCIRTSQTSLAVNTSINGSSKDNQNIDICKHKESAVENSNKNLRNKQERGIYSTVLEGTKQSTISTSLQMNTSLDVPNKLCSRENNITRRMSKLNSMISRSKDMEEKVDSTNTVQVENHELIKPQGTRNDTTYRDHRSNVASKNKIISDVVQDSRSYIEATPYLTSRSVLLKTQLKLNVLCSRINNNNGNAIKVNSSSSKLSSMEQGTSKEHGKSYDKGKNRSESIILDNSSSHPCIELQKSIIIRESTDESESKIQDVKDSAMVSLKKRGKKKLLPLHESSQLLTFSPVENENIAPQILRKKRNKRKKKQDVNNKLNAVGKRRSVEHNDRKSDDQLALENDNSVACDKKIQKRKPRKVISKKIVVKKLTANDDILRRLQESRDNCIKAQTRVSSGNSLNDFQSLKKRSATQLRNKNVQRISLVMTGLCNDDKNTVKSVVKALGHAKIESIVTKRTTHVVTTGVRTINMLHGIIRGCWLVSLEWVLKSLENSAWLNPEEYELTHFSKAVLENRKDRQLFGTSYVPELFAACGNLYLGKCTTPPHNVLKDLIKTAGGRITECPETAKIRIDANGLKESWVLDCITTGELQPFDQYQRS